MPRMFEFWTFLNGMVFTAIVMSSFLVPPIIPASILLIYFGWLTFEHVGGVILEMRKLSLVSGSFPIANYQVCTQPSAGFTQSTEYYDALTPLHTNPVIHSWPRQRPCIWPRAHLLEELRRQSTGFRYCILNDGHG